MLYNYIRIQYLSKNNYFLDKYCIHIAKII